MTTVLGMATSNDGPPQPSPPRMIHPLRVPLELRLVEVHRPQIPRRVPLRLILEVRRVGIAALATRRHRARPHAVAELDDRNEAVPTRPVPLLRVGIRPSTERGERTPPR